MELKMLAIGEYYRPEDDPIRFYRTPLFGRLYRNRVARCISMLPRGRRVLEIGYGSGVSFLSLGTKFDEIHGLDLHNRQADVVKTFSGTRLKPRLRQGNILSLPYEDNTFDAALAISIHEHLKPDEQAQAFREIRRVLRPGGAYVVGVPGLNPMMTAAFYLLGYNIHDHHFSSTEQVCQVMGTQFQIDTTHRSPPGWTKLWTVYLCLRGLVR